MYQIGTIYVDVYLLNLEKETGDSKDLKKMDKQKPVLKIKGAIWRANVGIHTPSFEIDYKGYREIVYWKITAYLN